MTRRQPATGGGARPGASPDPDGPFPARLARHGARLGVAGQRVARFVADNPAAVLASSALELAQATATSDATVIRAIQALGYRGLPELKQALVATFDRAPSPAEAMRHTLRDLGADGAADAAAALDQVLDAHRAAVAALEGKEFRAALAAALPPLDAAARIVTFGIGPSATLARYAATLLARGGRRSRCLDATGIGLADQLLDLGPGDAVLALAYGRPYREVTLLFAEARRLGLPIVLITATADTPIARQAGHVLVIPRGRQQRVALHGGTLVGLEALVLALAAARRRQAVAALDRLDALRLGLGGRPRPQATDGG